MYCFLFLLSRVLHTKNDANPNCHSDESHGKHMWHPVFSERKFCLVFGCSPMDSCTTFSVSHLRESQRATGSIRFSSTVNRSEIIAANLHVHTPLPPIYLGETPKSGYWKDGGFEVDCVSVCPRCEIGIECLFFIEFTNFSRSIV